MAHDKTTSDLTPAPAPAPARRSREAGGAARPSAARRLGASAALLATPTLARAAELDSGNTA